MNIIYISFFLTLNFFLFLILKKEVTKYKLISFSSAIIIFILFHFFVLNEKYINNDSFFNLLSFSLTILVFYFGSQILISPLNKKIDFNNHIVGTIYNLIRIYLIPIFVTLSQIIFIFSIK